MDDKTELLMKIVVSGSSAIAAESTLAIDTSDQLMEGFEAGRFFQISDFTFSAGLQDESGTSAGHGAEAGGSGGGASGGARRVGVFSARPASAPYASTRAALTMLREAESGAAPRSGATAPGGKAGKPAKEKPKTKFARFRAGGRAGAEARYPLEVEPIGFSRDLDQASAPLLQALCDSQSLASASIVRRVAGGSSTGGLAYLRLDFTDLLITGIDWDDDVMIKESFKFICRGVQVRYRPQNSDGSLGAAISGRWPMK